MNAPPPCVEASRGLQNVTAVKPERAQFEVGREVPKDDGLNQIEPDADLLAWSARLEARR